MEPFDDMSVKEENILRDANGKGSYLIQQNDQGSVEYKILHELELNGQRYAIMQRKDDHPDEASLFRIHEQTVQEIEDETEWEKVAEAIDEAFYQDEGTIQH
ncbi:DUF1292 domain-containing protein [Thermoflavimicrobium daqui]|jgi:hypothetical protein|nr:DUF1292 domain-containing protein [Thermoflavimicrobium daqui]